MFGGYYYIKVFYFGDHYHGVQRQPNLKTVEGELIKALREKRYIPEDDYPESGKIPVHIAGRTDKGVHARGMVFGFLNFRRVFHPIEVNKALPEDIVVWSYAKVHSSEELETMSYKNITNESDGYEKSDVKMLDEITQYYSIFENIRLPRYNALYRHYKYYYYDNSGNLDIDLLEKAAEMFVGIHELSNLCRVEPGKKTKRTMDSININNDRNIWVFDFKARSFLWQQIRRTMFVLLKVGYKDWPLNNIEKLFNIEEKKLTAKIEPQPGNGLILWDTVYPDDIKFEIDKKSVELINDYFEKIIQRLSVETKIMNSVKESFN